MKNNKKSILSKAPFLTSQKKEVHITDCPESEKI